MDESHEELLEAVRDLLDDACLCDATQQKLKLLRDIVRGYDEYERGMREAKREYDAGLHLSPIERANVKRESSGLPPVDREMP